MNVNEVIANRANELLGAEKGSNSPVHSHDDMNKSQSTNDVFSSSMQIATLLAMQSFADRCVTGLTLNLATLHKNAEHSLALATVLNTTLGYDAASKIAKKAYKENTSLKQSSVELGLLTEEECDKLLNPRHMIP